LRGGRPDESGVTTKKHLKIGEILSQLRKMG
jgi:hypothetical protein